MTTRIQCPFCCEWVYATRGGICPNSACISNINKLVLPNEAFTHKLLPIVIQGATSSGKTHFLAALLHRLRASFWKHYWKWEPIDYIFDKTTTDTTIGNPYRQSETILFMSPHITLPSTQAEENHPPMLLSLSFKSPLRHLFNEPLEPWRKRKWLITITDTAGEDSEPGKLELFDDKYAASKHAQGLIIMMDAAEVYDNTEQTFQIITNQGKKKPKIPTAFCLSKIDEIENQQLNLPSRLFDSTFDMAWDVEGKPEGKLMLHEIYNNSNDIRQSLCERNANCKSLVSTLDNMFDYLAFFGISALGIDPFEMESGKRKVLTVSGKQGFKLKEEFPQPLHVLDPFMWILWQHGLLDGTN